MLYSRLPLFTLCNCSVFSELCLAQVPKKFRALVQKNVNKMDSTINLKSENKKAPSIMDSTCSVLCRKAAFAVLL